MDNKERRDEVYVQDGEAIARLLKLMATPGRSTKEGAVAREIVRQLKAAGVPGSCIAFDNLPKRSPLGGEVGNLICRLPGTRRGPRRLMMAHMDTVPLCEGCKPVCDGKVIRSARTKTALGADDRAGVAVIVTAVSEIWRQKLAYGPLTLFFTVQEELGLIGSRYGAMGKLGQPRLCFNWDGGSAREIHLGATGARGLEIKVRGVASHAGVHPEQGVSAIAIAGLAIARLHRDGWFGAVRKGRHRGTSNIGMIEGGDATNVVTDEVRLKGEARSFDPRFRARIVEAYRQAFEQAARSVRNQEGQRGAIEFKADLKYEAFELTREEACVVEAGRAIEAEGWSPMYDVVAGGLDANWMSVHGLPTVTLGAGQKSPHTVNEHLEVEHYLKACRIGLRLATG